MGEVEISFDQWSAVNFVIYSTDLKTQPETQPQAKEEPKLMDINGIVKTMTVAELREAAAVCLLGLAAVEPKLALDVIEEILDQDMRVEMGRRCAPDVLAAGGTP